MSGRQLDDEAMTELHEEWAKEDWRSEGTIFSSKGDGAKSLLPLFNIDGRFFNEIC